MNAMPSPIEHDTGADPRAAIIVLHGLGADASDFVPFVREIDLAAVGPVRWIFPNAPRQPVSLNGGYVMPAWYDIAADRAQEDAAGLRRSQAAIAALIERQVARGIASERIVLGGFSQGCAMALLTGLRFPSRLAGILGMSGYLPLAATLGSERAPANADVPIFLAHGRQDEMIELWRAEASRDALVALGYPVDWHTYDMGHSVCAPEVADIGRWLRRVLAA